MFYGPNKPITILGVPTRRSHSDTEKIEEGHTEICCIAGEGIVDKEGLRFKISVRSGYKSSSNPQGRYYCIFSFRSLFTQQFAELFLHRDTRPDSPLPHVNCPEGHKMVKRLRDEEALQGFIQAGFRVIKKQQELNLPPTVSREVLSEEVPTASAIKSLLSQAKVPCPSDKERTEKQSPSLCAPSSAPFSEIEEGYEHMRQLMPGK